MEYRFAANFLGNDQHDCTMAKFLKIHPENPDKRKIRQVVDILHKGGIIVYPTDTIYGLGCDITNLNTVERIAHLKGIKMKHANFSIVCNDLSHLSNYVKQLDSRTFKLLKKALPGPYTFILPGSKQLPQAFKNKKTIGIRVPDHPVAYAIVEALGHPIVSTSVHNNDSIIEYATDPSLILDDLKNQVDVVIDSGFGGNMPSTVVDATGNEFEIIRQGKGNIFW